MPAAHTTPLSTLQVSAAAVVELMVQPVATTHSKNNDPPALNLRFKSMSPTLAHAERGRARLRFQSRAELNPGTIGTHCITITFCRFQSHGRDSRVTRVE